MSQHALVNVSGHDRIGIVRDVSAALLSIQSNIEDSSMLALRGRFVVMMLVRLAEGESLGQLRAILAELEKNTDLLVHVTPVEENEMAQLPVEVDTMVTIRGADQPGIVHAVADVMASLGVSVLDMYTQSRAGDNGDAYTMVMEVSAGEAFSVLENKLNEVGDKAGLDVQLHRMERENL